MKNRLDRIKEGHVVESYTIGNTRIKICDDSCAKTPEEVEEILKRVGRIALEYYCSIPPDEQEIHREVSTHPPSEEG